MLGDLSGIYAYHFKFNKNQYRIAYIVNEYEETVYILSISKRESFIKFWKEELKVWCRHKEQSKSYKEEV